MLHVGWLGDSEALLVKDGQPVTLVTPHKPERKVDISGPFLIGLLLCCIYSLFTYIDYS